MDDPMPFMLELGKLAGEVRFVMVIYDGYDGHPLLSGIGGFPFPTYQGIPDQVTDSLRAILISLFGKVVIEPLEKVPIEGNTEPYQIAHGLSNRVINYVIVLPFYS